MEMLAVEGSLKANSLGEALPVAWVPIKSSCSVPVIPISHPTLGKCASKTVEASDSNHLHAQKHICLGSHYSYKYSDLSDGSPEF
jgi:hypothetical protein